MIGSPFISNQNSVAYDYYKNAQKYNLNIGYIYSDKNKLIDYLNIVTKDDILQMKKNTTIYSEMCLKNPIVNITKYLNINTEDNLISILIPCYKTNKIYFRKTLDSILYQNYKNIQLVVIEDGIINDNLNLLKDYKDKINIKYVNLKNNLGVSGALSIGLNLCDGKYIARMDSDDIMIDNRIILQYFMYQYYEKNIQI